MSSKPPVAYMDIRVFAHATEDATKVQTSVCNLLPPELAETVVFEKATLTGHHGNPIALFTARLTDKKLLVQALEKIGASLSALDKEELCSNLNLHLERGNLYLRFDKQSAFFSQFNFSQNDPIHVKIHFKNLSQEQIADVCKASGLLP